MELCGLAVLDLTRRTAFHLFGFQTIDLKEDKTLIDFYTRKLLAQKDALLKMSKYLVVDAYFSKFNFVEFISFAGFYVVCRLRDDADLRYLFEGKQKGKGRTRKYDGKIDFQNLNKKYVKLVSETKNECIYSLRVNAKSLKRNINLVIVYTKNKKGK